MTLTVASGCYLKSITVQSQPFREKESPRLCFFFFFRVCVRVHACVRADSGACRTNSYVTWRADSLSPEVADTRIIPDYCFCSLGHGE